MMFTISVSLTVDTESPHVFSAFTAPELLLKSNPPGLWAYTRYSAWRCKHC
ncbi:hypothetical protein DPMN_033431 [Dreissena polymorpha]|uniref:Uncharacterized protein n=1 Tax=Dreissena polymorpha TaxID=45954 RepID=A0A9D4M6L7_DREPO|nr:hypothetical protein DPMN_033431 [Dreissena polymorpha]